MFVSLSLLLLGRERPLYLEEFLTDGCPPKPAWSLDGLTRLTLLEPQLGRIIQSLDPGPLSVITSLTVSPFVTVPLCLMIQCLIVQA